MNGSHHLAGGGQGDLIGQTRDTKVSDFDGAIGGDEQVSGFDISMDEACLVCRVQSRGGLSHVIEHLGGG